jgi:hypothetical protein
MSLDSVSGGLVIGRRFSHWKTRALARVGAARVRGLRLTAARETGSGLRSEGPALDLEFRPILP